MRAKERRSQCRPKWVRRFFTLIVRSLLPSSILSPAPRPRRTSLLLSSSDPSLVLRFSSSHSGVVIRAVPSLLLLVAVVVELFGALARPWPLLSLCDIHTLAFTPRSRTHPLLPICALVDPDRKKSRRVALLRIAITAISRLRTGLALILALQPGISRAGGAIVLRHWELFAF